jgi:ergothioneine biosynthesis protein EgtB
MALTEPLVREDFVVQSSPDVSPPKWHLAHTTWFFEEFLLAKNSALYKRYNPEFGRLFNSYYKALGPHWLQSERGVLSRPTVDEVFNYRRNIDEQVLAHLEKTVWSDEMAFILELGLNHEEQHQELLLMDIKHNLAVNPIETRYSSTSLPRASTVKTEWREFAEGVYEIGDVGDDFSFDNEKPRHKNYVYPFALSSTLVTNKEYLEFVESGSYLKPELWLSLGWSWAQSTVHKHPLYWFKKDGAWFEYTLHGVEALDLEKPVVHINYFEADAFARWRKLRLPTEQELEIYLDANLSSEDSQFFHPTDAAAMRGQVWAWTKSPYVSYPGFKNFEGAAQEYNGKFMCGQFVLRGGCVATPRGHSRNSYRNFYLPEQKWMFAGIRLAKDLK